MQAKGASDLHLHADYPVTYRIDGKLQPTGKPIAAKALGALLGEILSDKQKQLIRMGHELDFAYEIPSKGRYRANLFMQSGKLCGVFRLIPQKLYSFEELGVPAGVHQIMEYKSGMVLVTGATGSGKSTTMAAMLHHYNRNRNGHILTLEDPIEFVYESNKCMVSQKEIGVNVSTFDEGLNLARLMNPNIVLLGEIRDRHSMTSALDLSESGVLVLSTLHALDVANTVKRVMSFYDEENQQMIRSRFAMNIRAIVSMKLVPAVDKGRVALFEMMSTNQAIRNLILEGKEHQLESCLEQGKKEGMTTFSNHIKELLRQNVITKETASIYTKNH
jgi:twitching motility protein PilT